MNVKSRCLLYTGTAVSKTDSIPVLARLVEAFDLKQTKVRLRLETLRMQ